MYTSSLLAFGEWHALYARCAVVLALLGYTLVGMAANDIVGRASVIDGDTIDVHGERIRLNGIDTPESSQLCYKSGKPWRCGQKAALALSDHIGSAPVRCVPSGTDRYKRVIATCFQNGTDINQWLVANGWGLAYRKYSMEYVGAEAQAKAAKAGMWAGDFQAPWDWRANRRRKASYNKNTPGCAANSCSAMTSCAQAKHALNECGFYFLDGDGDGVPCESICNK